MLKKTLMFHIIFSLLFLLTVSSFVMAEETTDESLKATTIDNPSIDVDELKIMLIPLTRDELFVEANGWLHLLKQVSQKVSIAQLDIKKANKKISNEEATKEADEKIEEKMTDIDNVDNTEAKKKLKDDLKEEIKEDLKEEISDFKADIKDDIKTEIKDELKQELEKVHNKNDESKEHVNSSKTTKVEETEVELLEEHKEDVLAVLDKFREERRHIVERFNIVLEAINEKIGLDENGKELEEVQPYRRYIDAVSGLKLDVTDTKSTWLSIKGYVLSEDGGMQWIVNIIIFIAILFAFWGLSRILGNAARKAISFSESKSQILNNFFINSVRRLTFAVGILVALSAIGVSVAPIMAVIGAAGFVVAFALQGTLSNFASGIMIMLYRPFDVGDLVEVAGIMGKVKSMTLVSTTIMTPDNKLMIVPNNSIWGDVITNAHYSAERRVDMVFGIGYEDDIEQSLQVMNQVLAEHPLVLKQPEAVVQLNELADSSVNFVCRPWVKTADYWTVYWDVTRAVKEQFDAAGISIPYPQTDVHIHQQTQVLNESATTIPTKLHQERKNSQFNEIDADSEHGDS